jgi:hypothetical protein
MPFIQQVALPTFGLIEIFVLMIVVYLLTGRRVIADLAARVPQRARAASETTLLLGYAALGQVGGWLLGPVAWLSAFQLPHRRYSVRLQRPAQHRGALDLGDL